MEHTLRSSSFFIPGSKTGAVFQVSKRSSQVSKSVYVVNLHGQCTAQLNAFGSEQA